MLCVSIYLFIECSVSKNLSWVMLPPSEKSYNGEKITKCVQFALQPVIFGFMVNGKWTLSDGKHGKPCNSAWHGKKATRTTRKNIGPLRIKFSHADWFTVIINLLLRRFVFRMAGASPKREWLVMNRKVPWEGCSLLPAFLCAHI